VVSQPDHNAGWALKVPISEEFTVFVDDEGVLRTATNSL
jgi:hypothetical protein